MRTYAHNLIAENAMTAGMGFGRMNTSNVGKATAAANSEKTLIKHVKNVALFFAAPFFGLAYLLAFPVIGLGMLLWVGAKAVMKNETARPVALAIAAPVIALAFVTVGPIVALGALAATGVKALRNA